MATFTGGIAILVVLLFAIAGLAKVLRPEPTALSLVSVIGENRWPRALSPRWAGPLLGTLEIAVAISVVLAQTRQTGLIAAAMLATAFAVYMEAARRTKSACGCGGTGNDAAAVRDVVRAALLATATIGTATHQVVGDGLSINRDAALTGCLLFLVFALLIWILPKGPYRGSRRGSPTAPQAPAQPAPGATKLPLVSDRGHDHDVKEVDLTQRIRDERPEWRSYFADLQEDALRASHLTAASPGVSALSRRRILRGALVLVGGSLAATSFPKSLGSAVYAADIRREFFPARSRALFVTPLVGRERSSLINGIPSPPDLDRFLQDHRLTLDWPGAVAGRAVAYFSFWSPQLALPQYRMLVVPTTTEGFVAWSPDLRQGSGNGDDSLLYVTDGVMQMVIAGGSVTTSASSCNKKPTSDCPKTALTTALGVIGVLGCTTCVSPSGPLSCLVCAASAGGLIVSGADFLQACTVCEATQLQKQTACVAENFAFGYAAPCCIARGGNCQVYECCGCNIPGEPSCSCANGCPQSASGHACISYFGQNGTFCGCGCCCWMSPADGLGP